jgi:hypothetical protein
MIFANSLHLYGTVAGGMGTSTDGITWTARTSGVSSAINALVYDGAIWHAAGCNFTLTSTDAITWVTTTGYSGTTSNILALSYGNSNYVYGTVGGGIANSTDAHTWTARTSNTVSNILSLTYGTKFVYGTVGGGMATSTDGVAWSVQTSGTVSNINALTYGTVYVLGTSGGGLSTSTDAITWTARTSGVTFSINSLAYGNTFYIAGGNGAGLSLESSDSINWYTRTSSLGGNIGFSAISGLNFFVQGAQGGSIATALNDYAYDRNTQFQIPTDNNLLITTESATNFFRSLYIKAL